jgi:hypothetical protein
MVEQFVVIAGEPGKTGAVVCLVQATSAQQAHAAAATGYRNDHDLAPSVHVTTRTAHRCASRPEAELFYARLAAELIAGASAEVPR